jgi:hypothetical protein
MKKTKREIIGIVLLSLAVMALTSGLLTAQQRRGPCCMMRDDHRDDMVTIHSLFADREKIERTVVKITNGVETITESGDPKVAARIVKHAYEMKERLEKNEPIHMWDPLFAELFANATKIRMEITKTARGVKVLEQSDDMATVKLIQAHADVVSRFLEKGMSEMHERHEIP